MRRSDKSVARAVREGAAAQPTPVAGTVWPHLVLIQPDVGQPQGVVGHGVLAFRRAVGPPFSEDVSDSRARDDEEPTSTHPDLGRDKTRVSGCLASL